MTEHQNGRPGARRRRAANALLARLWDRRWLPPPPLDPDALVAAARRHTGLEAFGPDEGWRARLEVLVGALHHEARLTPLGRTLAYGQLVAALSNRLRLEALWQQHPEIAAVPFDDPVLIVGQMRSGTTRMQRLLALDPRLSYTRFHESWNPLPLRVRRAGPDDRALRAWLALRVAGLLNPEFGHIHPTGTFQPDEEMGLHNVSLFGSAFEAQWRIPAFAAHAEAADTRPVYAEFRRMLQTLAWLRREPTRGPWLLKLPQFAQDLDVVLETFPRARVICLSRDPVATVASSASLVCNQMAVQSDAVDPAWVGREWLRKFGLRQARSAAALARSPVPRVGVGFEAVAADWRGELARVYALLGLPLAPAVERRMAAFLAAPRHRALRRHRYRLADFGLDAEQIRALA